MEPINKIAKDGIFFNGLKSPLGGCHFCVYNFEIKRGERTDGRDHIAVRRGDYTVTD